MAEASPRRRVEWDVLGIEAAAIFFSVLLGFAVTEWREARANARSVEQAVGAYADEIEENQRRVAGGYAYHVAMSEALPRLDAPDGAPLLALLPEVGWRGPRQVVFLDAARETSRATGVLGLLPFDRASVLVGLYNAQDGLDATERGLAEAAFNPAVLDDANTAATLRSIGTYFQMVVEQEGNLLQAYRRAIEALDLDVIPAADTLLID